MPDLACDKCGKYKDDENIDKDRKCECGGNIGLIDHVNPKKASMSGKEPEKLAKLTSKQYITLTMIFMLVLVGILVFVATSSVFGPAEFYDVKCPYCHFDEVKLIDLDITNQSISISKSFDVYLCEKCGKQFYYDKEMGEAIGL